MHPLTAGYICAKVRGFADLVYGESRLLHPAVRKGPKGKGQFQRVSWDEALGRHCASASNEVRARSGGEAILPFCYGGSNGLLTQDSTDARLFRRLGASKLARTVCAAPTGAAATALYGRMAGVAYEDYLDAKLIVLWGVNPSASGIHLVPIVRAAQRRGAQARRRRPAPDARSPSTPICTSRSGRAPTSSAALAVHRHLFEHGPAATEFLAAHATGVDELRAARAALDVRARRRRSPASTPGDLAAVRRARTPRRRPR